MNIIDADNAAPHVGPSKCCGGTVGALYTIYISPNHPTDCEVSQNDRIAGQPSVQ